MIYENPLQLFRLLFGFRNSSTKNGLYFAISVLVDQDARRHNWVENNFLFCQTHFIMSLKVDDVCHFQLAYQVLTHIPVLTCLPWL
jgi:hypothetical protein